MYLIDTETSYELSITSKHNRKKVLQTRIQERMVIKL